MRRLAFLPLLAAASAVALAQSAPLDIASLDAAGRAAILGAWTVKDEDGARACRVTLTDTATIGGYVIEFVPNCVKAFPVMDEVASWRLLEGMEIVFADAGRNGVIRFHTPDAGYVAEPGRDGIFTIVKTGGDAATGLSAKNQVGLWDMLREGAAPVCRIAFTDTPAGAGKFTADLREGCADQGIRDFAPLFWSVEADHLTLYGGTGYAVEFVYDLDGNWRKDPPSGRELVLTKAKEQ